MSSLTKRIVGFTVTATLVLVPLLALWQSQAIFDWWRLRDYTPPAQVAALADTTTMTDEGRKLLYVYRAQLQDKAAFNESCQFGEQSIVLGCYVSGQGIYIYNVTDERLAGIHEVTAAHEMLHAAYERLSTAEREKIDALTQAAFEKVGSQRIKDAVEAYRKRDPAVVPNELHSIIATEVRNLDPELEVYYAQYFKNRIAVVAFSEHYEEAFTAQKTKADNLQKQIENTRAEVESINASLVALQAELEQEYSTLEASRSGADPDAFNVRVRAYNQQVRYYNAQVEASHVLIDSHNTLVEEYNTVVSEQSELIKAIDSRPEAIQQQ